MSEQPSPSSDPRPADRHSALFASLVLQQSNMALMFLGKTPNPESGRTTRDLPAARMFIDTLEMLEARTRGNLTSEEAHLLQETLTNLRLAFVEAANEPEAPAPAATGSPSPTAKDKKPAPPDEAPPPASEPPPAEESRKKFVKKY
jgi:hypothetical protein